MLRLRIALASLLLLSACSHHHPKSHEPENLGLAKQHVRTWVDSEAYPKAVAAAYATSRKDIEELLKEKSNEKLAVVFDIDETVLSNKTYYERTDFGFVRALFEEWLSEERCDAIPAALEFYNWIKTQGIAAFFISGRFQHDRNIKKDRTVRNLEKAGFVKFDGIYFRPTPSDSAPSTVVDFKGGARCDVERQGFRIIAVIGDQNSDLKGTCLGLRTYKIPNPMYYIPDGGRAK